MRGTSQQVGVEGVPEFRCVELLSEWALSVRSSALSHLLREVSLSVGAWNFSASWR